MHLRWSASLLPLLGSFVVWAVSAVSIELCEETSCQQPQENIRYAALMQRKKEHHVVAPAQRDAGPGTVRLFLSEMEGLAQRKGIDGLDPEEVQHVQTIKGLIADTIIPSILEGAEESRQEIAELYEAVLNCTQRATDELGVESTMHTEVEQHRDDHKECRKLEDETIKEKDRVCQQFNITRTSIELPSGEMPGLDADDATMIQYLKDMDEYFCGRMQVFKDEWDECEELTKNYTDIHDHCATLQQDLEESWCTWMTELDGTCGGMSECWQSTVARFNDRKTAIEQLVEDRKEALAAALKVQCLWDAWEWDREPCTVNETKVKECKDLTPNTTDIEVNIPSPPHRHPCNMSAEGMFPCNEAFIASEYTALDVSEALVAEMKDACSACPPQPTGAPVPVQNPDLLHMEHLGGTIYRVAPGQYRGEMRMESVTGVTFRLLDGLAVNFEIELYLAGNMFDALSITLSPSSISVSCSEIVAEEFVKDRAETFKFEGTDVASFEFTGEKFELKLNDTLVHETPFQVHVHGFMAKVSMEGPADKTRRLDMKFKTSGTTDGAPVPHIYGLERVGAASYKTTNFLLSKGGLLVAEDVMGVSLSTSSATWICSCYAGDWQQVEISGFSRGILVRSTIGEDFSVDQVAGEFKESDAWDIRLSGATVVVENNGLLLSTTELISVRPLGCRLMSVRISRQDSEADVSFDFARGREQTDP